MFEIWGDELREESGWMGMGILWVEEGWVWVREWESN